MNAREAFERLEEKQAEEKLVKRFRLHWRDGAVSEIEGSDIADAISRAGFGQGALTTLDYWEEAESKVDPSG
jgi:hypothetical protein